MTERQVKQFCFFLGHHSPPPAKFQCFVASVRLFFLGAAMAPQDLSCTQETELGRGSGPDAGAEVEDLQETSLQVSLVDRSEIF